MAVWDWVTERFPFTHHLEFGTLQFGNGAVRIMLATATTTATATNGGRALEALTSDSFGYTLGYIVNLSFGEHCSYAYTDFSLKESMAQRYSTS